MPFEVLLFSRWKTYLQVYSLTTALLLFILIVVAGSANITWVSWTSRGRDPYSNPKAKTAHAAVNVASGDIGNGGFPLACGRWAPDGMDAYFSASIPLRHCRRCEKALAKENANG